MMKNMNFIKVIFKIIQISNSKYHFNQFKSAKSVIQSAEYSTIKIYTIKVFLSLND
jgi:hypothetical protein